MKERRIGYPNLKDEQRKAFTTLQGKDVFVSLLTAAGSGKTHACFAWLPIDCYLLTKHIFLGITF